MPLTSSAELHVIAVVSNPVRYKSRYALYKQFVENISKSPGVVLWTVEIAYGDRPFEVTDSTNPKHIQLRSFHELWHKENMINVALHHLSRMVPDWEYVAWIDSDVKFLDDRFAIETIHALQHYMVVQMWQNAVDLGPNGELVNTHNSFVYQYIKGKPYCYGGNNAAYYEHWHPGYAWAARREAIDHLGGLIDTALLGAGDNHMAHALVGMLDFTTSKNLHPNYYKHLTIWQDRAERFTRRDVGYLPGTLIHHWHGKKKDRGYHDRWKILVDNQFDPDHDLKKDSQGLWQLADHGDQRSIQLRDQVRAYFRSRNEDSIDTV